MLAGRAELLLWLSEVWGPLGGGGMGSREPRLLLHTIDSAHRHHSFPIY